MEGKVALFFKKNPHYFGVLFVLIGLLVLISAVVDAHWLFGDVSDVTYDMGKVDGWVNFFGRDIARVIAGAFAVLMIAAGVVWFILYRQRTKVI